MEQIIACMGSELSPFFFDRPEAGVIDFPVIDVSREKRAQAGNRPIGIIFHHLEQLIGLLLRIGNKVCDFPQLRLIGDVFAIRGIGLFLIE